MAVVSILARRLCRALRSQAGPPPGIREFQSSPDGYAGRYAACYRQSASGSSFNPRPTVMPGATSARPTRLHSASFQSSPDGYAGRYADSPEEALERARFQSSPDGYAGRYTPPAVARSRRHGFNPRPTVMPGATAGRPCSRQGVRVSILARRLCRALRPARRVDAGHDGFQSSPDGYAGRYQLEFVIMLPMRLFQSSPDGYAGRYAL